jgi:hypothetical protein
MNLSTDHRRVFANAFTIRFSDNDVSLGFVYTDDPANEESGEVAATVVLTPRSVKVLTHVLLETIKVHEEQVGEIPLPEGKLEGIRGKIQMVGQSQEVAK